MYRSILWPRVVLAREEGRAEGQNGGDRTDGEGGVDTGRLYGDLTHAVRGQARGGHPHVGGAGRCTHGLGHLLDGAGHGAALGESFWSGEPRAPVNSGVNIKPSPTRIHMCVPTTTVGAVSVSKINTIDHIITATRAAPG